MNKISKDEAWKIYETLPKNLQLAIFSDETATSINNVCERNEIPPEVFHK